MKKLIKKYWNNVLYLGVLIFCILIACFYGIGIGFLTVTASSILLAIITQRSEFKSFTWIEYFARYLILTIILSIATLLIFSTNIPNKHNIIYNIAYMGEETIVLVPTLNSNNLEKPIILSDKILYYKCKAYTCNKIIKTVIKYDNSPFHEDYKVLPNVEYDIYKN